MKVSIMITLLLALSLTPACDTLDHLAFKGKVVQITGLCDGSGSTELDKLPSADLLHSALLERAGLFKGSTDDHIIIRLGSFGQSSMARYQTIELPAGDIFNDTQEQREALIEQFKKDLKTEIDKLYAQEANQPATYIFRNLEFHAGLMAKVQGEKEIWMLGDGIEHSRSFSMAQKRFIDQPDLLIEEYPEIVDQLSQGRSLNLEGIHVKFVYDEQGSNTDFIFFAHQFWKLLVEQSSGEFERAPNL